MSKTQQKISEFLFWFQILITVAFFIPFQVQKMLQHTEGVIVTSFLLVDIYAMFMLSLAVGAHRANKSRVTTQVVFIWILGVTLYSLFTIVFLCKSEDWWNASDSVNGVFALIGCVGAIMLIVVRGLPLNHPDVRMILAVAFRVIPQLMLTMNIVATQSSLGLSGWFIWCFHILIGCRITQTIMAIREHGTDRNRQCLLIAETLGWATWVTVTIAWLIY